MALYTTFNKNTTEAEQLMVLAWLASRVQDKLSMRKKIIIITGYLDVMANEDLVFKEIETNHMNKLLTSIFKTLVQMGVPAADVQVWEPVKSYIKGHQHRIDIFLQEEGETGTVFPSDPPQDPAHPRTKKPQPAAVELSLDSKGKLTLEGEVYVIKFGGRSRIPDIKLKKSVSVSPEGVSIEFGQEIIVFKKEVGELLKKDNFIEGLEVEIKLASAGEIKRTWGKEVEKAIGAKFEAAFKKQLGASGTAKRMSIQLFFSWGGEFKGSNIEEKRQIGLKFVWEFDFGGGGM